MANQVQPAGQAPQTVRIDRYSYYDQEILPKDNNPVAICRVRVTGDVFPNNSVGDRISLAPNQARYYQNKTGHLVIEINEVLPSDLRAAGGVDAYLKANPKADALSRDVRSKLPQTKGLPDPNQRMPWDFE